MAQIAALLACVILLGLGLFQAALIAGAPWGRMAWGGGNAVLPTGFRAASGVSIVIYALVAAILLIRAGVVPGVGSERVVGVAAWVLAAYFALGVVMNGISRSRPEQLLMTPVALALCLLCVVVALDL